MTPLGFIGAGKMATAMAKGLIEKAVLTPAQMLAAEVLPQARAGFTAATGVRCVEAATDVVAACDAVILAVKPQAAEAVCRPLAPLCAGKLIISIAAGIPLARLAAWVQTERLVRVMPNTPLMVGKGASVFCCGAKTTESDRDLARRLLGAAGIVFELAENQLDAVTALSGSGPAYIFEMIQALTDAGVDAGLPPDIALELTAQTVAGAAAMVQARLGTPDELRTAVTSPGGTTAAALAVLNQAHFRTLIRDAVRAAKRRSIELGRGG
ncbi:MAG: pyrroline-5-carboxylate reductase [Lentisphaerae bacterium RIFOXYB12_FULL_65_16]|nr:MAG: pyrroline-5-carboxylate reductase [Lentisphaerae bacterium RIFOXYA12_64_32]OGV92504.1 MAG: pyrroline-5-carboxylate reductase [Lentisphaerae bacterium RIFOXYB12_FULL_65_16]